MPDQEVGSEIERLCIEKGMRMTDQRRVIASVLSGVHDHPDAEGIYRRSVRIDPNIDRKSVV